MLHICLHLDGLCSTTPTVRRRGRPPKNSTASVSQVAITRENSITKVTQVSPIRRRGRPKKQIPTPGI